MADLRTDLAILESPRPGRFRPALTALLACVSLGCPGGGDAVVPALTRDPDGSRVVVEVLNATPRRGLARIGTRVLREHGLDVVFFGNADTMLDSTRVLIRRGSREAGERVARALGRGVVEQRIDTLRRVDVTVLLGSDWTPPPDPRP